MTQYIGETQFPDYSNQPKPNVPAPWMQINPEGDTITAYDFSGLVYPNAMFAGTRYKNIDLIFPDALNANRLFQGLLAETIRVNLPKATSMIHLMSMGVASELHIDAPLAISCFGACERSGVTSLDISLPQAVDVSSLCEDCKKLTDAQVDLPKATALSNIFSRCSALRSITMNIPSAVNPNGLCNNCVSLKSFSAVWSNISSLTDAFINTGLEADALNNIFESLPTWAAGNHVIGIKGAVGAETCDVSIAEQKGWTVVR